MCRGHKAEVSLAQVQNPNIRVAGVQRANEVATAAVLATFSKLIDHPAGNK